jgi:YD repeat-containing protein
LKCASTCNSKLGESKHKRPCRERIVMKVFGRSLAFSFGILAMVSLSDAGAFAQSVTGACLYALDPSAQRAFQISGSTAIYSACSIAVESNASQAFEMEGSETLYLQNHAQVGVVGQWQLNGNRLIDPISNQQVQPVAISSPGDPLASIQVPTQGTIVRTSHTTYDMNNKPQNSTLVPGVYCGGLTIGNTNGAQFTMSSGTYIMAGGGLIINSAANVAGTGVTVYNTSSAGWGCSGSSSYTPITISGQARVNLSAPIFGSLAGILLFGNRTGCSTLGSCQDQVNGGSSSSFSGALYFASDKLLFSGAIPSGSCLVAVADMIGINGNSTFGSTGCAVNPISVTVAPQNAMLYSGQTQQFFATVTNSNNQAVTWSISPAGLGTISTTGLYTAPSGIAAQQTVTVTATSQADSTKSGTGALTLLVTKATPVITWTTPSAITYGMALSGTQLDATTSVPGTFVYTPAAGTVATAGSQMLSVTFTPTDTADYTTATASVTLMVNRASPAITWTMPAAITYGMALSGMQLDATASVPGTFVYTPAAGTVPTAGSQILSVTFTPTDTADYTMASTSVTLTVTKASPVITWATPAAIKYGTGLSATQLDTTASVPGTFVYMPAAGTVPTAGSQTLSVTFTPTDTADYTTATASVTLAVDKTSPVIAWTTPAAITYGTALSGMQLDATADVQGTFAYTPAAGTVLPAGSQMLSVIFTPSDATDYATATASVTLEVNQAAVSVSVMPPRVTLYAGQTQPFSAVVTNASNTAVTWSITPAGMGSISPSGLYTAPTSVTAQTTVTVTATSTADATRSATATVTLMPTVCGQNGYTFERSITIDHTQVPNTDQRNFPFLFSVTDPTLATIANGGHVTNPRGYDITFTSDQAGQHPLDYEMEEYNPATGQVIAWVRIPTLSHTSDITLYAFYGNPNITTSQQNASGVWDQGYVGVWHVPNGTQLSLVDSTSNANNASNHGAVATAGQVDGGMLTDGSSYATLGKPASLANLTRGSATFSAWINTSPGGSGVVMSKVDSSESMTGWALITGGNEVVFEGIYSNQYLSLDASGNFGSGAWSYVVVTLDGSTAQGWQATMYVNGIPGASAALTADQTADDSAQIAYLGNASFGWPLEGESDEFRISNTARSADWIAAEYANQSSSKSFFSISPEDVSISPSSAILYASQAQQFVATDLKSCSNSVMWSANPLGIGTMTSNGLYTAPESITAQQTLTITATSQSDSTKSASATVTLMPPVAVTVTPASATLSNGSQQQQFTANVINTANTGVTWSVAPAGTGSLDANGLYTAPPTIPAQQTIIVTATSVADPTKSSSATVTLTPPVLPPPVCPSTGYSFERAIVIDHNRVPNSDQASFPFLFNSIDPALATTSNGGHVANAKGLDIMFSADPSGQTMLNYEIEKYDPVTGQLIAWIQIPKLSHSTDTGLYMFYGNSSIGASLQNPAGVWDPNFVGIWHVSNGVQLSLADSTSNANNGTNIGAVATAGEIDGGMSTAGNTYATLGAPASLANLAHGNATFSAWINPTTYSLDGPVVYANSGIIMGKAGFSEGGWSLGVNANSQLELIIYDAEGGYSASTIPIGGGWTHVDATVAQDITNPSQSLITLYINGSPSGSYTVTFSNPVDDSPSDAYLASNDFGNFDDQTQGSLNGSEDELRISNTARSPDWIATEFNNQGSPSTFYAVYPENTKSIVPVSATLYASQGEQFSTIGTCSIPAIAWSMPVGSPGTLTDGGLYTAPAGVASQQAVMISGTSQADGSSLGTAVLTLMPPISIGLAPTAANLQANQALQFTATVTNASNTAVNWSMNPAWTGTLSPNGLYQAPRWIWTVQTVTITATSQADRTQSASATITLIPAVSVSTWPSTATLSSGQTQQFSAYVAAGDNSCFGSSCVSWSISPAGVGTIDANGLYTAPSTISTQQTVTVTAISGLYGLNSFGTATITLLPPSVSVSPQAVSLSAQQKQQFVAAVSNSSNPSVTWSISPDGAGTIDANGIYTAPNIIGAQQTVAVTANNTFNGLSTNAGATITLLPPSISVSPQTITIYGGQKEQFQATLTNSPNHEITWSISPSGIGSISPSGLYTAPPVLTSQQNLTITAASQMVPSISASAVLTLSPTQCAAKAYSYVRSIIIDHTKVPTDQANFPFYFSVTDPSLASTDNGGHVASAGAYDIVFSTDPAGLHTLDYELEQYDPVAGHAAAWIRVPSLSHESDTVLYMFYGNAGITASQENPSGVWDSNYAAVYQFDASQGSITADQTTNGNSASENSLLETSGAVGGAVSFDGTSSFMTLPASDFVSYPISGTQAPLFNASFEVWFKTASAGVILGQTGGGNPGDYPGGWIPALYVDTNGNLRASFFDLTNAQQIVSAASYNDNVWHHAVLTFDTNTTTHSLGFGGSVSSITSGVETLYVDGQVVGTQTGAVENGYNSSYSYFVGTGYTSRWAMGNGDWFYYRGALGPIAISNIARSSDWVTTEFFNQSSPTTFFALSPEVSGNGSLNPPSVTLYGSQSQQFTLLTTGMCDSGAAMWSMPAGSPGTLSPTGLYVAPEAIATQQSVTITATTLGASSASLNATVTLMPPVGISVTPANATLAAGGAQQFLANIVNAKNTGVSWSLAPGGLGSISSSGLYTAPASIGGQQTVIVTGTSLADPAQSASATINLSTGVTLPQGSVSINPTAATLYANQTQQFSASVFNSTDTSVTWSISPTGVGSIDSSGLYTAPPMIGSTQTVMVTATSQANTALSASANILLSPAQCVSNGYSYYRAISIDHTKIPNADQTNFPVLFDTTDPSLATSNNGGHVSNSSGFDLIFTSDSAGQSRLDYEIEKYDPVSGHVVAWVRVPALSHTSDTVLYLFYGNPNVTASQQNPTGVWDANYLGVWHLGDGSILSLVDSTSNANNATNNGALASFGPFAGGMITNGTTYATLGTPSDLANLARGQATFSAWVKAASGSGGIIMGKDDANGSKGWALSLNSSHDLEFVVVYSGGDFRLNSASSVANDTWTYVVATLNGNAAQSGAGTVYINGASTGTGSGGSGTTDDDSAQVAYLGNATFGDNASAPFAGSLAEFRLSNSVRSVDWIAAEYNNQSSPSTFYTLYPENAEGVVPDSVTLYSGQSQLFVANSLCNSGVTWSMPAGAPGTLTDAGLYTAPATISEQQTVAITATSQAGSSALFNATVTLMPAVSVSVAPASLTLTANQAQLFTAAVSHSSSQAVTWTISPTGLGAIDEAGAYVSPSSILSQQTVVITATSRTDPTKSASAMVTLAPTQCASIGYGYQRVIVIDHTKVANSDQTNFPFLFNTTDPDLASIDHGGHVANPNGYDIIFSTDPNGRTKLDHELEQYNAVTGQLVAWIRIPNLSHSTDTVIYVFYGNASIATSEANPTGVWDRDYQAVYHLGEIVASGITSDSTKYGNDANTSFLTAFPGQIDGAAFLDGVSSSMEIPSTAFPSYPTGVYTNLGVDTAWNNTSFSATFGIWFKTASWGGLLDQTSGETCVSFFGYCIIPSPELPGQDPYGSWGSMLDINFNGNLEGRNVGPSVQAYNDNKWHFAVVTFENGTNKLYADGQLVGTGQNGTFGYEPNYAYFVGTLDIESDTSQLDQRPWRYLNGQIDEISVSKSARSGDWVQTQYNNQSSSSTFYAFYPATTIQVVPSKVSLYAAQAQQFAVPGTCDAGITWSMPTGSIGILSSGGMYTAPTAITTQQTALVNATSQSNGALIGSAQVTLLPPPKPIILAASSPSPYSAGSSQAFVATILDENGNAQTGVSVSFSISGVNGAVGNGVTDDNGNASFTYAGAHSGTDTIQATAYINGEAQISNSVTATWLTPPPVQAPTVTLLPQPSPGRGALVGAFTDNNGAVIEPIVIGAAARSLITPAGATRLQLGVNDSYYEDNGGSGFVVKVNGLKSTVPPKAMPWNWKTGALNNNYQYGINDGSDPVVAAANLTSGQIVTVEYQSGTVSTDFPVRPVVNADGEQDFITGTRLFLGAYFPTLYTTGTSYPEGQPMTVFALVTDATGLPIPNLPVTLNVSGANPGQYQATSDSTGSAAFIYSGSYAGSDALQAQAVLTGQGILASNQTSITWTDYPTPPPVGSLSLSYIVSIVNSQFFSTYAKDSAGNPLPNVNIGFYVTGADTLQTAGTTNDIGQGYFSVYLTQPGNYQVIAVDSVGRNVIVTQPFTGNWVVPTGTPTGSGGTITINITADTYVSMPDALQLNGTVTDSGGSTPVALWSLISGPGKVTFADPTQPVTTAAFSQVGTYVLQLSATDSVNSGWAQFTVRVVQPSTASEAQGWIGAPAYGSSLSGIVPITLAPGISLASGTLSYTPANDPNSVTILNANVSGSGQIGTLDTTMLANGSYWIQMQATDTSGKSQYSLVLVTATGNYKPGRVTSTVTDLIVPSTGLAINIQRTYDSLNAGASSDFGYGWSLGINVNLVVDPNENVTFTLGGQRKTFQFTPQHAPCSPLVGCLFPWLITPAWTPEPGLHGTLIASGTGCTGGWDVLTDNRYCQTGGPYTPPGYIYTDPTGTQYTVSAGGALQSIADRNGHGLTITPNGITSNTGLNVPFVRDSQNRITQITDPLGNVYLYGYDENGNLANVYYPNTQQPSTYTYDQNHYYLSGTDFRSNPLPSTNYYTSADKDPAGNPLSGRLKSVTDGLGETTGYAYDLSTYTTTVTYPPDGSGNVGKATMVYDGYGNLLSSTDPLGHSTTNIYGANQNLTSVTDPLGHTTSYTYDTNGNRTSQTYPGTETSTNTSSTTVYNQYSEPISATDELGNIRIFNYDANFNPLSVTDSAGTLMSSLFNANGTMQAGAIGFDITTSPSKASQFTYDADGNLTSKTDALGRTTSYTYDQLGHKISMIEPLLPGTSAAGATNTYQYDAFGHLTQATAPLGRVSSSQYDANGNKTSDTDARGNTTGYQYDALNRLILTTYPDGTTAGKTYDFRGNVIKDTDQAGHVTFHEYDLAGREVAVTQAFGTADASTTSYTYYDDGRKKSETDALGHTTSYVYDAAGNLISVSGVKGNIQYGYDNARNRVSMTDGNGHTTQYEYDARKRLTQTTYPDGTTKINAYDGPGNLVSVTTRPATRCSTPTTQLTSWRA